MLHYEHNNSTVSQETMKCLLGKKYSYIVDTCFEKLQTRKDTYKIWLSTYNYTDGSETRTLYISITTKNDEKDFTSEKVLEILLDTKSPRTHATNLCYTTSDYYNTKHESTYYKDWTIPNAKKLEQIIFYLF